MSRQLRFLRWVVDEIMASLLVIAILAVLWAVVMNRHMLPIAHGAHGSYAEVAIPEILTLDTKLISFTASVAPGRVVSVAGNPLVPLPDMLYVEVRYSDASRVERTWEESYFIACDEDEFCAPVSALSGVTLSGRARNGGAEVLAWASLSPKVPLSKTAPKRPTPEATPTPKPAPNVPTPRVQGA